MEVLLNLVIFLQIVTLFVVLPGSKIRLRKQKLLIDTSVLMDGRIVGLAKSGFIPTNLVIPNFVVRELQEMADNSVGLKRQTAREGLEVIEQLRDNQNVEVILHNGLSVDFDVDAGLLKLAHKLKAEIFTLDYNLQKVATAEGIEVLNINKLSQVMRLKLLPGEKINIKIISNGEDKGQGVGYLDDGTMIVVEKVGSSVGKVVAIKITKYLQTAAGRMYFGEIVSKKRR